MRILITGGAGFIGSHLCDRFLSDGHTILVYDNFATGHPRNVAHLTNHPRFTLIEQDVTRPFSVDGAIDVVMHFASPASPSKTAPTGYLQLPIETLRVGSLGTFNALEIARAHNAKFMIASTSEVYGDPLEHPQRETYWGHVDPIGVRSVYDEAKRFGEAATMAYHRKYGVNTRLLRIFNTYGPRMELGDGRVVPNFVAQALRGEPLTIYGDGAQTRSFCYVGDLVEGIMRLLDSNEHGPVNLGNPREMSILEFAQAINRLTGNPGGLRFLPEGRTQGDPQRRQPDISKAKALLGWEPRISLEDGLKPTIEYFSGLVEQ
jgi:dTDP-glucose 4,6-dehydratase